MQTKKSKVVMLPTGEAGKFYNGSLIKHIAPWGNGNLSIAESKYRYSIEYKQQHLYFISDDEIKDGDWFIDFRSKIDKYNRGEFKPLSSCKKIIASTDPSLGLPTIPESFLKMYVEAQGKIDEVRLEMYRWIDPECPIAIGGGMNLKLTPNNEVIVVDKISEINKSRTEKDIINDLKWANTPELRDLFLNELNQFRNKLIHQELEDAANNLFPISINKGRDQGYNISLKNAFKAGWEAHKAYAKKEFEEDCKRREAEH